MSGFDEIVADFKKDFGEKIGGAGAAVEDIARLPSGWFPLDLAIGGGIPMGKITEIYGKESSGKTNLAMRLVSMHQKLYPNKKNVWFDTEHSFNKKWARKFGVQVDENDKNPLYIFHPDYGEAIIDMMEDLMGSPECGLIVIDSVAAIVSTRELKQSGETDDVGGSGKLMSKLIKKTVAAASRAEKEGYSPTVIAINQTRNKIGVMFGNPETTPGGDTKNYAYSLRLRLYGKGKKDAKYHDDLDICKDIDFKVVKHKVPIVAGTGQMDIVMIPHKGLKVGDCDDFNLLKQYMEKHEILVKSGTEWVLGGDETFATLKELRAKIEADVVFANEIRSAIIEAEKEIANREENEGSEEETEEVEEKEDEPPKRKKKKKK